MCSIGSAPYLDVRIPDVIHFESGSQRFPLAREIQVL